MYVDRWSASSTWGNFKLFLIFTFINKFFKIILKGGEKPPGFNESAIIPAGQHVLFDVDNTADSCLWSITIEGGTLIFEDWGRVTDPAK